MGNEFRLRRRVQFYETDAAGIVHFSWYFRYFEEAEHALWRETGMSIHSEDASIGWPRISASCDFHKPLKFEEEFDVSVQIMEITRRTITYAGEITREGERIARGSWRIASVTKLSDGTIRSADIPERVVERLKPFAPAGSSLQPPASA
ncbi:MAG TPA: thioesterase family protein [Vicinamibacterales bacterium]